MKRLLLLIIMALMVALIMARQQRDDAELLALERLLTAKYLMRENRRLQEHMETRGIA